MAATCHDLVADSPTTSIEPSKNITHNSCVKVLVESSPLKSIPPHFTFTNIDPKASSTDSLPTIDFSSLASPDPDQRSKVTQDLRKACEEWGFFVLVNHQIPVTVLKGIIDACSEYYELPEEEKERYEAKSPSHPIKTGIDNLMSNSNQGTHMWRDFFKTYVHPEFHCPPKPQNLREILFELSERSRSVARKLVQGIGESLGFEEGYVDEALKLESGFQVFAANFYPACPYPDQAIGIPSHTDPGLLTFLMHNGVAGLQIEHDGQWFDADSPRDSILVITGDHLEIFTNGKCKGAKHRAVLNSEKDRVSIVVSHGPSKETVVSPAEQLVLKEGCALYRPMKYIDYMEWLRCNRVRPPVFLNHPTEP